MYRFQIATSKIPANQYQHAPKPQSRFKPYFRRPCQTRQARLLMIGLLFLGALVLWALISVRLGSAIQGWLRIKWHPVGVGFLFALIVFVAPWADEIIGRWQFAQLCKTEAVVWVGPKAEAVVAAKDVGSFSERTGLLFPVRQQSVRLADLSNGQVFYTVTAFHTPGGVLMRAGLGLGNSTSCWPERWTGSERGIDTNAMMKRGEQLQMLELFGTQLRELRSSTSAKPLWVHSMPEPRPLVGTSREAALHTLGAPDTCPEGAKKECMSARSWSYWFFHAPGGSTGLTPVLHIEFGANDVVESAKWSFSK